MQSRYSLDVVLHNRRWWRRNYPFPHVIGKQVFKAQFYNDLAEEFRQVLSRGLSESRSLDQLSRGMPGYDAYGMTFPREQEGPFSLFLSREWHDMLASLFSVRATGHINCGLHYHLQGSASGWVHNDLNPGWFVDSDSADGITAVRHELCSYAHGQTFRPDLISRETVRAVAMLFYLNNPSWSPGDGGATGLYSNKDDRVEKPATVIGPINNSILAFECTPYSFHSFISNWRFPRCSVIMWLHRAKEEAIALWGEGKIVKWPLRNV